MKPKQMMLLLYLILLLFTRCDTTEPPDNCTTCTKSWQPIPELTGIDIWDVKINQGEIYIAGRNSADKGIIYKSSNGINWQNINPTVGDSLDRGVGAIDFYNGELIAAFTGKPVYLVTTESVTRLTDSILNDVREIIVDKENNILIGTGGSGFFLKYVTKDSMYDIYDSLFTPSSGDCSRQSGIQGSIGVSKFLSDINSDDIFIGNYSFNYHFVTIFTNRIIDCYPTEGLSSIDKFHGCHDIVFINDTLFAAGKNSIKFLYNNTWKTYGDTLPKTPDSVNTIATSIAYDEVNKEIYVAANYIGVVKWNNNLGWMKINDGLESYQGYYDFIPDINYFKDKLILTYGTSKNYKSSTRGAMFYSIK